MAKLFVTGDTHGEERIFTDNDNVFDKFLATDDFLFVCGDFGYVFNGGYRENMFLRYLAEEKPYTICFVDGNHENFDLLNSSSEISDWNGGKVHIIKCDKAGVPKIIHLMRGQVFEIERVKIFTFGGGYSIDRHLRRKGFTWWEEEMPNRLEIEEAYSNLKIHEYQVDYILTHTAPEDTMSIFFPDHEFEKPFNNVLEYIREKTTYKHWYFGHLHLDEELWRQQTALYHAVYDMVKNERVR